MLYQLATIKVAHMAVIFHLPETPLKLGEGSL
ncbi:hypothetical protein F11_04155 [Rhodospirillum rubrum F11]|nr:hypothetical protein F11_04155 [Rhodospirillum rubrum F11]